MPLDRGALDEVCAWLRAGAGGPAPAGQVIETHAACVFLIGSDAYKVKKAVDFGYLDFSTPPRRAEALRNELALNKTTAPDIYRAVATVTRQADGGLAFDGPGEPLEAVLRMRAFDPSAVLSETPASVEGDFAEDLGRRIADLHAAAAVRPEGGGLSALTFVTRSNAGHLRGLEALSGDLAQTVIDRTQTALAAAADLLERRRTEGWARRCHGDLHLGNIVVIDGAPVPFDCIEFNDRLADIDVLYDLAFLLMDLTFRGGRAGAGRVLNGYLDQALRGGSAVVAGLACLPLMMSVRAVVRAHVSAQMGDGSLGRAYLQAALDHLDPPAPSLLAIGGLSGSGKSTAARALAPRLGPAPGAVILRSDEIRKRLAGVGPRDRLPQQAYGPGASERVYAAMLDEARMALTAGRAVVLDAVFLRPSERQAAAALADECGAPFTGLWLQAPPEVLMARVEARVGDASDADARVLAGQLELDPGVIDWRRLDVETAIASA